MKNAFDIGDARVRAIWSATVPAALVLLYIIHSMKLPKFIKQVTRYLKAPFRQFITLEEAEALDSEEPLEKQDAYAPLWSTLALSWIALLEACGWMGIATYKLISMLEDQKSSEKHELWQVASASLMVFTWLYAAIKPMVDRKPTPQYDLFVLYLVLLSFAGLVLGGAVYDRSVHEILIPRLSVAAQTLNLGAIASLLVIILSKPVAIPSKRVDPAQIGKSVTPEDYTSLWGWITFSWVQPLIDKGTYATLNEDDVWNMSPLIKTKPIFRKYSTHLQKSLFWQLLSTNSLDLITDFVFTIVSVLLNYSGPLFLKLIIDAIDHPNPGRKVQAYIYAFLALIARFLMAESDLQHLYYGRRACTRFRAELMTAIFVKALKRRDFSGVANLKKSGEGEESGKKKDEKEGKDEVGADLGKIVNLMSGDVNSITNVLIGMPFAYQAPVEIAIACAFLYQLLGWAAFVGFLPIFISWPINSLLTTRFIKLRRLFSSARDKRMSIVNELIGAIKFIKFFAWEDKWIKRALDQRSIELGYIVKNQITTLLFLTSAAVGPVFVSVVAFYAYVAQGKELTVGIAFTAIQLFTMIRTPLNVLPTFLVQIVQVRVCFQRIQTFLGEEEVDEQVSVLKRNETNSEVPNRSVTHEIGLRNATLQWNKPKDEEKEGDKGKASVSKALSTSDHEAQETASMAPTESSESRQRFELTDVSVIFPQGMFSVVTGPTASGKTALLLSLLGEMTLLSGEVLLNKDTKTIDENGLTYGVSYAAQTPWLQQQSIKDNIIFGYPFDEARYKDVLECCALNPDLKVLEDGDRTEIGARGVSLSGGQKARVALARAVYARTKYVLLDDPLSAVDSHTARFLYERLFLGPLMRNRTVILVTHHVELVLPGTYYLVRMLDGRIDKQGTVKDLRAEGALDEITLEAKVESDEQQKEEAKKEEIAVEGSLQEQEGKKEARKLVEEEERAEGGVKWSIYKVYLKASSYWTWIALFVLLCFAEAVGVGEKWWIMKWGEAYGDVQEAVLSLRWPSANMGPVGNQAQTPFATSFTHQFPPHTHEVQSLGLALDLPSAHDRPMFYVAVYALIGLFNIVVTTLSYAILVIGVLRASRILFKRLLISVVHATMRWHDTTPTGRILNRFSKDIETIDNDLGSSLQNVNSSLAAFAASTVVIIYVFPVFSIPAFILGYLYYKLAIGYLNTGRDLRRMESNARSPLFSGFSDVLEGIVTVRAFSADTMFLHGFYEKVDLLQKMWYAFWMTNRYLLVRFDCLGAIAIFVTSLFALSGLVSAGLAGLCITSAMSFSMNIYWTCRFWTTLELDLNSVERLVEYLNLPQEPPSIIENSRPPAHWPSRTGPNADKLVEVEDLEVKYAPDLPAVLHGISFILKAGERVGLLGRTGSGKSTLAMSLLRFVDPAKGRILVDGIDITSIGVEDLRSRLTFIPQDASLFSGKLRDNLDPFGDYSDIECLDVLHRVHMMSNRAHLSQRSSRETSRAPSIHEVQQHDTVSTIVAPSSSQASQSPTVVGEGESGEGPVNITLDTEVSAGGLNFSAGQRQLIALARALLRHSAIVIFDEATSSIDFATDAKIQETIREEFTGSLLLTIAHRLRTVIDYDRLIVLDSGNIAEFDTPWNLIQKENGIFRQMCQKSGSYAELEAIAKAKANGQDHK